MTFPSRSVSGVVPAGGRNHTGEGDLLWLETAQKRFVSESAVVAREPIRRRRGSSPDKTLRQARTFPMTPAMLVIQTGFLIGLSLGVLVLV
jgi:hypothetical protein